jgi:two-component system, OmpR family, response regulator
MTMEDPERIPEDQERILYVDDEPDIRAIAKVALEVVGGFEVLFCGSGREAIDQAPHFAPDLIILDVMMPEMDGPSTFAALRRLAATAATPVIFMTAKVQKREIAQYLALGAVGVIHKPFDPMTLADDVRELWLRAPPNR